MEFFTGAEVISLFSTVGAVEVESMFLVFCSQSIILSFGHSILYIFVENAGMAFDWGILS